MLVTPSKRRLDERSSIRVTYTPSAGWSSFSGCEVDRRIPDLAADALPPRDDPVQLVVPPEHRVGVGDLSALEGVADPGRGDRLAPVEDLFDARGGEAALRAHALQERQVAALAPPEGEVLAEVRLRRAEPLGEKAADEVFRLGQREVARERDDEEGLDPEGLDRLLLLAQRLDLPRRGVGPQDRQGMRLEENRDRGTPPASRGAVHDGLQDPPVTEVHAVEVPDRDDSPAREVGWHSGGPGRRASPLNPQTISPTRS